MSIADKNRKILWARSGNRCAICRLQLVAEQTIKDSESVLGEECHIISPAPNGPRHELGFSDDQLNALDNFILLCATHHKMIDNQCEKYSVPLVREIKQKHESWVETKLCDESVLPPVRIRRFSKNIPTYLLRISSGKDLLAIVSGCMMHYFDHDHDLSEDEVELVGGFAQEITNWADLGSGMEAIEQVRAAKRIQDLIKDLEAKGFFVFAGKEDQQIEGGVGIPSKFPVVHLSVLRASNPSIQRVEI